MSSDNTKKSPEENWKRFRRIMCPSEEDQKAWRAMAETDMAWMHAETERIEADIVKKEADIAWMEASIAWMEADAAWRKADIALLKAEVARLEAEINQNQAKLKLEEATKKAQDAKEIKLAASAAYQEILNRRHRGE